MYFRLFYTVDGLANLSLLSLSFPLFSKVDVDCIYVLDFLSYPQSREFWIISWNSIDITEVNIDNTAMSFDFHPGTQPVGQFLLDRI